MYTQHLVKPDGRSLWLYARQPIGEGLTAPSPQSGTRNVNAHLRWHPLRGEWVAYANHRQNRTFLPPAEYNPLAVTTNSSAPTELPSGEYQVAVFENRFPTFAAGAHDPPREIVPTLPAR